MSVTTTVKILGLAMIAVGLWYLVSAVTTILVDDGGSATHSSPAGLSLRVHHLRRR